MLVKVLRRNEIEREVKVVVMMREWKRKRMRRWRDEEKEIKRDGKIMWRMSGRQMGGTWKNNMREADGT